MDHWRAEIGIETRVWRGETELPPPPGDKACQLLNILADNDGAARRRKSVATVLFPDASEPAARNALRQTLLRFKRWLGPGAVEADHETVRLATGAWSTTFKPSAALAKQVQTGLVAKFRDLVVEVARFDRDEARAILIGGKGMALSMTVPDLAMVVGMTSPPNRNSTGAFEHLALRARVHHASARLHQAVVANKRVYAHANSKRKRALMSSSAASVLFSLVESGDFDGVREWLPIAAGSDRTNAGRLLAANARACFHWNDLDIEGARDQFARASKLIRHASRFEQVHYWSNYAVFAMESGLEGLCDECCSRARELLVPELDPVALDCLALAEGLRLRFSGQPWPAITLLEERRGFHKKQQDMLGLLYATEIVAEAYARVGNVPRARMYWRWAEQTRHQGGGVLTPRLKAMRDRIHLL